MNLRRDIFSRLETWKDNPTRKPLIIHGARQIGKTWTMRHFGETHYRNVAYFNFEASPELSAEFEKTKDVKRLLATLSLFHGAPIEPRGTLVIFDEIQECNAALNSLKYFCEDAPEYHVMAAGSLLGVALASGDGFPVGKTDFLQMYPVTFKEFLNAADKTLHDFIDGITSLEPLPEFALARLEEHFRRYQVCGGMPAAMVDMLSGKNIEEIEQILKSILTAYALDFSKHAPGREIPRITAVWDSIPSQLARENRKFLYKNIKPGARAREYEDALLWLKQAGLTYQVFCASRPGLPISAYDDLSAFKIYMFDTALLRVKAGLSHEILLSDNPLFREFKGAMAENQVLQSLVTQFDTLPRYWVSSGTAEVDFILQTATDVIPIEVKAATNTSGKSLKVYCDKFSPARAVIYSRHNLKKEPMLLHIPIYLADWTARWLAL